MITEAGKQFYDERIKQLKENAVKQTFTIAVESDRILLPREVGDALVNLPSAFFVHVEDTTEASEAIQIDQVPILDAIAAELVKVEGFDPDEERSAQSGLWKKAIELAQITERARSQLQPKQVIKIASEWKERGEGLLKRRVVLVKEAESVTPYATFIQVEDQGQHLVDGRYFYEDEVLLAIEDFHRRVEDGGFII